VTAPPGRRPDEAVWTRVDSVGGAPLDLLAARFGRRHYAPHTHEEYAVGVCTDGLEVIRYRGGLHRSGPDSLVVVEPGEAHTGGPAVPDGFAYRVLYPTAALLTESAGDAGRPPHFRGPVLHDAPLAAALRSVHLLLSRGHDPLEAETRLLTLLGALTARHAAPAPARRSPAPAAARVARLVRARLADEMPRPPALAEIAADLGLSRYQVLRAFREAAGMPPYAWLAQHRVTRARALLETGHRPAEVAGLVGFADQAHLTRWFRRVLGVTPGAYRNSVQDAARARR